MAELELVRGGREEAERSASELRDLWAEVYADPPYRWDGGQVAAFADRLRVQRRQPGFVLAEARNGGYLVGCAFGLPLRPSTDWWRELTAPLPDGLTAEHAGRTFAVAELLVRAPWRRQGIAAGLHDELLAGRPEERATAAVLPAASAAQQAFRAWGWQKAGRKHGPQPGGPVLDVLLRSLPAVT